MKYYFRFLLVFILLFSIDAKRGGGGSRRSGSSSGRGSSGTHHRTTSRPSQVSVPHTQHVQPSHNQRSQSSQNKPPAPGWNVPQTHNTKPSAPVNEHASKTSASNTQSGWVPSGGYGSHPNQNQNHGAPPSYSSINHSGAPPSYGTINHGGAPPSYGSINHGAPPSYGSVNQGGYHPQQTGGYGGYHPQQPGGYGGYHPQPGGYHAQNVGGGYHAAPAGNSYHQPSYNPYSPSYGHSATPGAGYNPPVGHQTVIVAGQKPSIGQMVKEAVVYSATGALVNAGLNRIIPGGIYGTSWSGSSHSSGNYNQNQPTNGQPSVSNTYITYNNYGNGTAQPGQPEQFAPASGQPMNTGGVYTPPAQGQAASSPGQPAPTPGQPASETSATAGSSPALSAAPSSGSTVADAVAGKTNDADIPVSQPNPLDAFTPTGKIIKQADFENLTHNLFLRDTSNAFKFITLNLQGKKTDDSINDIAPDSLLTVKGEAYEIPTIKALIALYDNYHLDVNETEIVEREHKNEQDRFMELITASQVMTDAFNYLVANDFISNDKLDFEDTLKRIWFSKFQRTPDPKQLNSCGFETIFMAEHVGSEIIGLHDWVYYAKMEENKTLNYLGYIKDLSMENEAIIKHRSSLNDVIQPVSTIFVGTSPEYEIAVYTLCYFIYFNGPCPVKIHQHQFSVIAFRNNVAGKEIMPTAYPEI